MNVHFGLESHSDPAGHDDGTDEFIIEKYRAQIDELEDVPKVSISVWNHSIETKHENFLEDLQLIQQALMLEKNHKLGHDFDVPLAEKEPRSDNPTRPSDTYSMNDISREELDAKIEATHARVEARLAGFESTVRETLAAVRQDSAESRGELKAIHVELSYLKNLKANIWGAAVVTVTLVSAFLAYGVSSFDSGRDTAQVVQEARQQTVATQKLLEQIQLQLKTQTPPAPSTPAQ